MGMRLCLELLATSIHQLHDLETITESTQASDPVSQNQDQQDLLKSLQSNLEKVNNLQRSLGNDLDRYRELFEFAPDGYFVTDANGDITEANRAATLMFGSHPIGKNLENFVYPSYKEQFHRLLGQLQRGQNIKSLDFRMQFPTGQPFDASFTIISIRTPSDGKVMGMRWWMQDITQRKQEADKVQQSHQRLEIRVAEMNAKLNLMDRQIRLEREEQRRISRNLARNEAKLRAIMQHSSDIVNILDIDTTIHYCSPALFRTLGYLPEDVIGKKFVQFIHPEDLHTFQSFLTQSVDTLAVSKPIVMRHQHIDGSWIYLESVCCNLLQDVNVQGLVINSRDITDRKKTEAALQESELRLAAIASSMPATLYRLSIDSEDNISIPFISDGLIDLVGILPKQVMNKPQQLLDLIHPEDVDQFKALIKAGFERLATFRHEFRIISTTGEIKWVQNIARYYQSPSGLVLADGVCIDISERGEAEANLQRTNELLQAVIKAVPVAIDVISPEGKVLLWNAHAEKLFAWNSLAIASHSNPSISESQALELQATILDTLAGRPLDGFSMSVQLRDGDWINVRLSTVLVHDLNGKIVGVLRIIDEVGDRHFLNNDAEQDSYSNREIVLTNSPFSQFPKPVLTEQMPVSNSLDISKAETLSNQYKIGQRNFAGLNLRGAYLMEFNLRQVDFSGVALNGANCSHANLQYANLRGADLRGANFQNADLKWADLRGADLRGADLRGADTTDAIFDQINFADALLSSE